MEFKFKLRTPTELTAALAARQKGEDEQSGITTPSGVACQRGEIVYEDTFFDNSYALCSAYVFEKDGMKVFIADPTSKDNVKNIARTAIGLVKIEAPSDMDPKTIEHTPGEILEKDLGIPDAISEVLEGAEGEHKMALRPAAIV